MSKILTSGCGITFAGAKPTWVNVLRICGLNITDLSGPAISNTLILNQLIEELYKNRYDYVICQLTANKKLDVELNDNNRELMSKDSLRNFSYKNYWPSSVSKEHDAKQQYYKYLYSPTIEEQDLIIKLLHLQNVCAENQAELFIMQGYDMNWANKLIDKVDMDTKFVIQNDYKNHETYKAHDFSNENTVPNKLYQIELAKYINKNFFKWHGLEERLEKFNV